MQGIVIRKSNRTIVTAVKDVTEVIGNNIFGSSGSVEGINLDEAEIIVIDSEEDFKTGDILPADVVNHIADLVRQKPEEIIAALVAENADLRQQLASTNADLVGFQSFIFEKFPELA